MDNPINGHEAQLIQNSFQQVETHSTELTELFYTNLFERAPEIRDLFPPSIELQKKKLLDTLNIIVNGCMVMHKLVPAIEDLGRQHKKLNPSAEDYQLVGQVLIESLSQYCAANWNEETTLAWQKIYDYVANIMMSVE